MIKTLRLTLCLILCLTLSVAVVHLTSTKAAAASETWHTNSSTVINVRSQAAVSGTVIAKIPASTTFSVSDKLLSGGYVWGKVNYSGKTGWCALNYASYVSGCICAPNITGTPSSFKSTADIILKWNSVPSAQKYTVSVYSSSGARKALKTSASPSTTLRLEAGSYYAVVTASNTLTPSWSATGAKFSFNVINTTIFVTSVAISDSYIKVSVGKTDTLNATIKPTNATNKSLSWSSSNPSVASVSSSGTVTGKGLGKAVITCSSKDGSNKYDTVTVVVDCGIPSYFKQQQTSSGNTERSVRLRWGAVNNAAGYAVYRYSAAQKKYVYLKTVTTDSCTVSGLNAGITYTFMLKSIGIESGTAYYSNGITCTAAALPSTPVKLRVTALTQTSISFNWSAVKGAEKYYVFRYDASKNQYVYHGTTVSASYKAAAAVGTKYYFKVLASKTVNGEKRNSAKSDTLAVCSLPAQPIVTLQKSGSGVNISWNTIMNATGYEIYMSTAYGNGYSLIARCSSGTRSFREVVPTMGKTYYFRVRAYITFGGNTAYGPYSFVKSIAM